MSEVAGKIATQAGAFMLEKPLGGRGILLGGVPGVAAAKVMVIGGGVVGMNAAFIAIGMEAEVYVYDRNIDRLRELDLYFAGRASTCYASTLEIEQRLPEMDLVIGAVLVHGAKAPYVIRREQLALMKKNAVLVDVSIDQGGCFETSRPTTHSDPTFEVDGITHYCVANMPGAVPVTSTYALTNATLPYVLHVADAGVAGAARENPGLARGVNVVAGKVTYEPVADGDRDCRTRRCSTCWRSRRRPEDSNPGQRTCSVGRIRSSLIATRRGRVTMYSIASAMSPAASRSMSPKPRIELLAHLRADVRGQLRRDRAGLDHRDAHVLGRDLLAQRLRERADRELRRVVDTGAGHRAAAGDRGDVDQVGDLPRAVRGGRGQVREGGVRDVQEPLDVEVDHPLPLLDGRVLDRPQQHDAGVVDHDVEAAELVDRALDRGDGLLALGHVGLDHERPAAGALDPPAPAPRAGRAAGPPARPPRPARRAPPRSPRRCRCWRR